MTARRCSSEGKEASKPPGAGREGSGGCDGEERRAGAGKEGGAEEGGEAREEVERRAAEQREDLVGRERLRVARYALPSRRRPPGNAHHPRRPHRHESKSAPKLNRRPPRHLAAPARRAAAWISPPGSDGIGLGATAAAL
jgi:hypothetical protein